MQIYFEEDYPNSSQVIKLLKEYNNNINPIIFDFYVKKEIKKYNGYFGFWDDFYIRLMNKMLQNIFLRISKDKIKNKLLNKKLIRKKLIRKYFEYIIDHIRYKPGGIKYLECMNRFNSKKISV